MSLESGFRSTTSDDDNFNEKELNSKLICVKMDPKVIEQAKEVQF